jgi:2-haloacid dehalogenase
VKPAALCFDLYGTLVDVNGLRRPLEGHTGRDAARVNELWRQKQLEYTWRLTAMEGYRDFDWVTRRALWFALTATGHEVEHSLVDALMAEYGRLAPFADADAGLERMAGESHRLAVLSNGTPAMLDAALRSAGLESRFEAVISADEVRAYKPAPRVYRHAAERLGLPVEAVMMVSANPFDIIGARAAGMTAAWVRRSAAVFDPLDHRPSFEVGSLVELAGNVAILAAGG